MSRADRVGKEQSGLIQGRIRRKCIEYRTATRDRCIYLYRHSHPENDRGDGDEEWISIA